MIPIPACLAEFQKEDVRTILAADSPKIYTLGVGNGKTLVALTVAAGWLSLGQVDHVLVLCPKSTLDRTWKDQLAQYYPSVSSAVISGDTPRSKRKKVWDNPPQVLVANWHTIANDYDYQLMARRPCKWGIIGDESHITSNPSTNLSQAFRAAPKSRALLMTGTLLDKSPMDVYGQLTALNLLNGMTESAFKRGFCLCKTIRIPMPNTFRGYIEIEKVTGFNKQALPMVKDLLHRHTMYRPDTLVDLPPLRSPVIYEVTLSKTEQDLYALCDKPSPAEVKKMLAADEHALDGFEARYSEARAILSGKRVDKPAKDAELIARLTEILDGGETKVLVYTPFAETVKRLKARIEKEFEDDNVRVATIIGEDSRVKRAAAIDDIREQEHCQVLLITDAGKEGIDGLQTTCNVVIFFDLPFTPGKMKQIVGRVYRRGQKRKVAQIYLVTKGSLEYSILDSLDQRQGMIDTIKELQTS